MKSPAFQFYPADFLVGIMGLTDEETGVYMKMLAFQWLKGGLPPDIKTIKTTIGCRRPPSDAVLQKFKLCEDGLLRNERLESERNKQSAFRASRTEAGAIGGRKRAERIQIAREKATHTKAEWEELRDYFEGCCICGETENICKDHIKPIYQGGSDGVENLQPLCARCNSSKGPDSTDHRASRAAFLGKQMPSIWVARATERPKQIVALQSSSSTSVKDKEALPFSSTEFAEAWKDWKQFRKEKRAPVTPTMAKQQFADMVMMGEARAIAAIRFTIGKGWQGLREPDAPKDNSHANSYHENIDIPKL